MQNEKLPTFRVVVKENDTDKVEQVVGEKLSATRAERVERGLIVNLDHDRFYTDIEEE